MEDGDAGPHAREGELDAGVPGRETRFADARARVGAELLRERAHDGNESNDDGKNEEASHRVDLSLHGLGTVN